MPKIKKKHNLLWIKYDINLHKLDEQVVQQIYTHQSRLGIVVSSSEIMGRACLMSMRIFAVFISGFKSHRVSFSTCITHFQTDGIQFIQR